ncbi:MAG: DUF4870 domain-containing protein [Arenimonas sp.]|nr:DUF4870 domain-containing protein [Arenimonas sp.]MBP7916942.1 DUF4870 domain-containing protein [Arenimonas sp.]
MSDETSSNADDTTKWAGGVHVAALLLALFTSWSAGVGGMIAAFVVWLMKKDQSALIRRHAAEAFNFNFSMFIYTLIAIFFAVMTLGIGLIFIIPLAVVVAIVWIWCTVQAAIAGFDGKDYRYPLTFRIMN